MAQTAQILKLGLVTGTPNSVQVVLQQALPLGTGLGKRFPHAAHILKFGLVIGFPNSEHLLPLSMKLQGKGPPVGGATTLSGSSQVG